MSQSTLCTVLLCLVMTACAGSEPAPEVAADAAADFDVDQDLDRLAGFDGAQVAGAAEGAEGIVGFVAKIEAAVVAAGTARA